jgi:hypothetical protein
MLLVGDRFKEDLECAKKGMEVNGHTHGVERSVDVDAINEL